MPVIMLLLVLLLCSVSRGDTILGTAVGAGDTLMDRMLFYYSFANNNGLTKIAVDDSIAAGIDAMLTGESVFTVQDTPVSSSDLLASDNTIASFPVAAAAVGFPYGSALPGGLALPRMFLIRLFTYAELFWDDPQLTAANPGVALPHQRITVLVQPEDQGPTRVLRRSLVQMASNDGISTDPTSILWLSRAGSLIMGNDAQMIDAVRTQPYAIGYALVPNIAGVSMAAVLSRTGTAVIPTADTMAASILAAPFDSRGSLNLLLEDASPSAPLWPIMSTVYGLLQISNGGPNDSIDCAPVAQMIEFFVWLITNPVSQSEVDDAVGAPLPFRVFRPVLEFLELSITCKGALALNGRGHAIMIGTAVSQSAMDKTGQQFTSFQPKHPFLQYTGDPQQIQNDFLSGLTAYMLHPVEQNATVVDQLNVYQFPVLATAGVAIYNIPELIEMHSAGDSVVLDMPTIAAILQGDITLWNHPSIIRTNKKYATMFPAKPISVVVHTDPRGETQIILRAIAAAVPGFSITPSAQPIWPAKFTHRVLASRLAAETQQTPYAFSITFIQDAIEAKAKYAKVLNSLGESVMPTAGSVQVAMDSLANTPDIFAKGTNSIRISNYAASGAYPIVIQIYFVGYRDPVAGGYQCDSVDWDIEFMSWLVSHADAVSAAASEQYASIPRTMVPHVLLNLNNFKCNSKLLDLDSMALCPLSSDKQLCGGPAHGECLGDDSGSSNLIKCVCSAEFTGTDCSIPVVKASSNARKFEIGFGISVPIVLLLIAIISWRRARASHIWMIERTDFVIDKLLARGGFSIVFSGTWKATTVAVKVIPLKRNAKSDQLALDNILAEHDNLKSDDETLQKMWHNSNTRDIHSSALSSSTRLIAQHQRQGSSSGSVLPVTIPGTVTPASGESSHHVIDIAKPIAAAAGVQGSSLGPARKLLLQNVNSGSSSGAGANRGRSNSHHSITTNNNNNNNNNNSTGVGTGNSILRNTTGSRIRSYISRHSTRMSSSALTELAIVSRLRHPNIAFMVAACIDRGNLFLLMEYMDAGSLYDVLRNSTFELVPSVRLRLVLDACRGLQFLHQQDPPVLHMDLKTPNILVDSRFTAKLTDFGLSSVRAKVATEGTLPWTAPEVIAGQVYTKASDIYSIGIVLWELQNMRATAPWEGRTQTQIRDAIANNERPPLSDEHCPLGKPYAELIRRCWAANPLERPPIEEVARTIDKILGSAPKLDSQWFQRNTTKMSQIVKDLPASMQAEIARGEPVTPLPLDSVTMIFTDIVGFTRWSSERSAQDVSEMLAKLHDGLFDKLVARHGGFHLETIGDAYIVVLNFPHNVDNHVERAARLAFAMCAATETLGMKIRAGVHTGPAVATVVGTTHPKLTLLGDTVNTASRMETISPPGKVTVSDAVKLELNETFVLSKGKLQEIKGKGLMQTFVIDDLAPTLEV